MYHPSSANDIPVTPITPTNSNRINPVIALLKLFIVTPLIFFTQYSTLNFKNLILYIIIYYVTMVVIVVGVL